MADIFVCYRRADSRGDAGRLVDSLEAHFNHSQIFRDVESLEAGVHYKSVIEAAIAQCVVLLAVIGPRWLEMPAADGSRRLDAENDFIRLEIGSALRQNITVVPVLVGGADMPAERDLPEPLKHLAGCQAVELSDARWDYDVNKLIQVLSRLPGLRRPWMEVWRRLLPDSGWIRWPALLLGLILALAGITHFLVVGDDPVLDNRLRLVDVDLQGASWAEANCIFPTDCDSRDGRLISSMIRLLGSDVRYDSEHGELHVVLTVLWVLREGKSRVFHRGYSGKIHYSAALQRSTETGRVVVGEFQAQQQSMSPFNGLLAYTLGCIEIPFLTKRDAQIRAEIKRRLENAAVLQELGT